MAYVIVAELVANVGEVLVAVGDEVGPTDTLVILESMKMEIPVLAEVSGVISRTGRRCGRVDPRGRHDRRDRDRALMSTPAVERAAEPDEMANPGIRLRGVRKEFGPVVAVDHLDLDIADGEFFAVLGPSGSGKTTVLRMIAGFETPTTGTIELGGVDATRQPPFRRNVNTVFQDYALFPHMTVEQNVGYGLRVKRVAKPERARRVGEALEMVRLGDIGARKPSQLSGGQRQRVALARALVNRPRVLLLDEPLGALDLKLREQMQVELKAIQREVGITFVFVTHDQDEALTLCDRLAVMRDGRIEQVGRSAEVYESPATQVRGRVRGHIERDQRRGGASVAGYARNRGDPSGEDPHPGPRRRSGRGRDLSDRDRARGRLRRLGDPDRRGRGRRHHADRVAVQCRTRRVSTATGDDR